ncbi:hypothetical protein PILCRDRAFT_17248 [Piloderma croceum F 1598]|uniref:Uncharacterized protein n=1 Tax=Piloderma croceum (strain F 1598) TaxID=765440 RepID=A0A0C3ABT1_PILCF|nr:hypothetical protein PILCRDRAFT_17248 [Piloderma croceum F 1598]
MSRHRMILVLLPSSYDPVKQAECSSAHNPIPAIALVPDSLAPSLPFALQHSYICTRHRFHPPTLRIYNTPLLLSVTPKLDLLATHALE